MRTAVHNIDQKTKETESLAAGAKESGEKATLSRAKPLAFFPVPLVLRAGFPPLTEYVEQVTNSAA